MNNEDIKRRIRHLVGVAALGSLMAGNVSCQEGQTDTKTPKKPKTELVTSKAASNADEKVITQVTEPVLKLAYRTDTLSQPTSTLLYYLGGSITRNFIENNESFRMQLPYFVHENHHHSNEKLNFKQTKLSPEEILKLRMHDEISANLAAILTARYEYLAAEDKDAVIKKYEKTYMGFYFDAIKTHQIDPSKKLPWDRKKEWSLLANGTREMWMRLYSKTYANRLGRATKNQIQRCGLPKGNTHQVYEKFCREMYRIGGVDFWRYMKEDIAPKNNIVSLADDLHQSPNLKSAKGLLEHLQNVSPLMQQVDTEHKSAFLQHMIISGLLKEKFKKVDAVHLQAHPQIVSSYYRQVVNALKKDPKFAEAVENYAPVLTPFEIGSDPAKYDSLIGQLYQNNGVDMRKIIDRFDNEKVPLVSPAQSFAPEFYESDFNMFSPMEQAVFEDMQQNSRFEAQPRANVPQKKRRLSDEQFVEVPNFDEPILISCTPEQNAAILSAMQKFEKIPAVLKGCNLKAQQKYLQEHPQTEL